MIATTVTVLALLLAVLLAVFGVAGFTLNWHSTPDHDSLTFTQWAAKTGRYAAYTALALHAIGHTLPATPALLWSATEALAAATYLTRTSNHIIPTGATP